MDHLEAARKAASCSPDRISAFLYGGTENVTKRRDMTTLFESDPKFDKLDRPFQSHTQRYLRSIAKCAAFHLKTVDEMGLDDDDDDPQKANELRWAYEAVDDLLPTDVHMSMFLPALEHQTSQQQKDAWFPLAKRFQILGAYVQTELGHGSNVRALETTATLDLDTDSFVIHSPTLSSTKWWPGGLGKTATHCILHARMLLPSTEHKHGFRDMGVHPFFVPLRSVSTHRPFDGVLIGDIGPKLGFNSVDNGYARFRHYRIPRTNLLGGVATVDSSGKYTRARGGEKRMYGAMLAVRASIVSKASVALGKALTIGVRYSLFRHQGYADGKNAGAEVPVMHHPTQKRMLLPWFGLCYALHFTGQRFHSQYQRFLSGDVSVPLDILHMESSGLKALITQRVADGIECIRKLCGGHGYSALSGLPEISNNYLAVCTLEGTAQVLEPQTARFLLRAWSKGGKNVGRIAPYLSKSSSFDGDRLTKDLASSPQSSELHMEALGHRARCLTESLANEIQKQMENGATDMKAALSRCGVASGKLARAHSEYILLRDLITGVDSLKYSPSSILDQPEIQTLKHIKVLFGQTLIESASGELCLLSVLTGPLQSSALQAISAGLDDSCNAIAPEAIALVDGWDFTDAQLAHSAIGGKHGNAYQKLYEYAQREPLNGGVGVMGAYLEGASCSVGFAKRGGDKGKEVELKEAHIPHIQRLTERQGGVEVGTLPFGESEEAYPATPVSKSRSRL